MTEPIEEEISLQNPIKKQTENSNLLKAIIYLYLYYNLIFIILQQTT